MTVVDERRRVLALDDGGLRSVVTMRVLARLEDVIRRQVADDDARLGDHFDLIAGAGSGGLIAALLCRGWRVAEIEALVADAGPEVLLRRSPLRWARTGLGARYADDGLDRLLATVFADGTGPLTLGSDGYRSHLLLPVHDARRRQTVVFTTVGSAEQNQGPFSHGQIELRTVLRAAAATPAYFGTQPIEMPGDRTIVGTGAGVTGYKSPTLLALMAVASRSFGLGWETSPDRLLIVAVGAGTAPPESELAPTASAIDLARWTPRTMAVSAQAVQDELAQFLGRVRHAPGHEVRAGEAGAIDGGDSVELFSYVRYDTVLDRTTLDRLAALHAGRRHIRRIPVGRVLRPDRLGQVAALRLIGEALADEVRPMHLGWA